MHTSVLEKVRFCDVDSEAHVNYASYLTYLEEAINCLWKKVMMKAGRSVDVRDIGFVTVHLEIDYRHPAKWRQELEVDVKLTEVGRSSFTTEYEITDTETGNLIVEAESVQVVTLDREEGGPMPDDIYDSLTTFYEGS